MNGHYDSCKEEIILFLKNQKNLDQEKKKLCIKNGIGVVPVSAEYQEEISVVMERSRTD